MAKISGKMCNALKRIFLVTEFFYVGPVLNNDPHPQKEPTIRFIEQWTYVSEYFKTKKKCKKEIYFFKC